MNGKPQGKSLRALTQAERQAAYRARKKRERKIDIEVMQMYHRTLSRICDICLTLEEAQRYAFAALNEEK